MRIFPVDPVANSAQTRQVAQVRLQGGSARTQRIVPRPWAAGLNRAAFDGGAPRLDYRTSLTHGSGISVWGERESIGSPQVEGPSRRTLRTRKRLWWALVDEEHGTYLELDQDSPKCFPSSAEVVNR